MENSIDKDVSKTEGDAEVGEMLANMASTPGCWFLGLLLFFGVVMGISAIVDSPNFRNNKNSYERGEGFFNNFRNWNVKDVGELRTSSTDYITVNTGEKFWFPIKESDSEEFFVFKDYFEVVSILGDPNDPTSELTNFSEDDIWLLIRGFRADYPQYLILQVRNSIAKGNSARTRAVLEKLSSLFRKGEFIESSGSPRIKSSGVYLYIKKVEAEYKGRLDQKIMPAFRGKELLEVNQGHEYLPIHAKIFGSEVEGQLVVLVDLAKSRLIKNIIDQGWIFDHSTHISYRLHVVFVSQEFVKSRPELQSLLPSIGRALPEVPPLVDWDSIEEKPE